MLTPITSYWQFIELCILLGCDYLEPIKGVGPKSALKLMKEHGTLEKVVVHLRAKSELKAAKVQKKTIDEDDVESEDEIPPSSDVEQEGMGAGSEGEAEEDETTVEERRKQKEMKERKKKAASRRGTGGVHVPENWMWEEAKKLFKKPDVTSANEIEVSPILSILAETIDQDVTFLV